MRTLQDIANETVAEFTREYEAAPDFWCDLIKQQVKVSLRDEVVQLAIALIKDRYNPDLQALTEKSVAEWISSGVLSVGKPNRAIKAAFREAVEDRVIERFSVATYRDSVALTAQACEDFLTEYREKSKVLKRA